MPLIMYVYFNLNNFYLLIDTSFFAITVFLYNVKLVNLYVKRKKIEQLFKKLNNPLFNFNNKEHLRTIKKFANIAKYNSLTFITMCWVCIAMWVLIPKVDVKHVRISL